MSGLVQMEIKDRELDDIKRLYNAIILDGHRLPADIILAQKREYHSLLRLGVDLRKRMVSSCFSHNLRRFVENGMEHLPYLWAGLETWPDVVASAAEVASAATPKDFSFGRQAVR